MLACCDGTRVRMTATLKTETLKTIEDAPIIWKHGLGPAMRTESLRLLEIRNWLRAQVKPRVGRHVLRRSGPQENARGARVRVPPLALRGRG